MKSLIPKFFHILSIASPYLAAKLALMLFTRPRRKARPDKEMKFLTTGKQITFQSSRKARSWGKGPVIWLLHGWESRGSTFIKLVPLLVEKGFQVVAWDGPAHGESPGKSTNLPEYARCFSDDLNEGLFEQAFAFVGHSFGGAAMAILSKIQKMPAKVVIVSAPSRIINIFNGFAKMINLSDKASKKFIALAESKSGYSLLDCSLVSNDISTSCDTLVIHDRDDDVIPFADFEALQEAWASGEFLATENLGHRLTIKNQGTLGAIVGFIVS